MLSLSSLSSLDVVHTCTAIKTSTKISCFSFVFNILQLLLVKQTTDSAWCEYASKGGANPWEAGRSIPSILRCCSLPGHNWYIARVQHVQEDWTRIQISSIWFDIHLCGGPYILLTSLPGIYWEGVPCYKLKIFGYFADMSDLLMWSTVPSHPLSDDNQSDNSYLGLLSVVKKWLLGAIRELSVVFPTICSIFW